MSQPVLAEVLRYVGKFCNAPCVELSDAELLQHFLTCREETAFAVLVQRHGPMVLSVCHRVLGDAESAQDAFQATFLVLVQRAASIRKQQSVASWLYGVAQRVASKARARSTARLKRERRGEKMLRKEPLDELTWQELRTVLDEEIARLPEKNRTPLVLCYFQGKTQEQAAVELGWPTRSLTSRVARGRELLRRQLLRRGISLPAAALATALCDKATGAPVGALLTINTVKAAMEAGAGKAAAGGAYISAGAAALAEHALNGGFALRAKLILATLVFGLAVGGVGLAGYSFEPALLKTHAKQHADQEPEVAQKKQRPVDLYGDPLPQGAIARMGTIQFRHSQGDWLDLISDPMIDVAFSPDGQVIATSCWGRQRLWNASTGNFLFEIKTSDYLRGGQVFSPDGRFLAVPVVQRWQEEGAESHVCLWDAKTGKLCHRFPRENGLGYHIRQVLFSPDNKLLAMADEQGTIHLWNKDTAKEVAALSSKSANIACLAFSPDGKTLVTLLHQPRKIWRWDIAKGEVSHVVSLETLDAKKETEEGRTGTYHNYLLSQDGRTLACRFYGDRSVRLLDTSTGKVRCQLQDQIDATGGRMAFTPDGRLLAVAGHQGGEESEASVSFADTETGKLKHQFKIPSQRLRQMTFSPDGSRVAIGGLYIRLYDVASGNEVLSKPSHEGHVCSLAFTPDSSTLISGGADGLVGIWDAATGKNRHLIPTIHWGVVTAVAVVPGGSTFVSGGQDGIIRLCDWRTGKEIRRFGFDPDNKQQFKALNVSGNGKTVVSQAYANREQAAFHSWDLATGKLLGSFPNQGIADPPYSSADGKGIVDSSYLSADGTRVINVKYLTPGHNDYAVEVREIAGDRQLLTMRETDSWGHECLLTADGRLLIGTSVGGKPTIRLRELATGKLRLSIVQNEEGGKSNYENIALAPDGRTLATARGDKTLQLWDLLTGKELMRQSNYAGSVQTMTFSPNSKYLATSHEEGVILIWDVSLPQRKPSQVTQSAKELDSWWKDLAGEDAAKAHTAIGKLVEVPQQAVALFKDRLRPAADKSKRIAKLIAQLDDDKFAARDAASKELKTLGSEAEQALRWALGQKPSLEKRRRIDTILDRPWMLVHDPEVLQGTRAIEVLEYIAVPGADTTRLAAIDLLKKLAGARRKPG
jgi:RNA polymerase sigma factor (sigma-70 family)